MAPKNRLLALDVMRGITIAGMIMVNNPGSWGSIYTPLGHASWHGLTPTDLVFPFFMFIMGISTYFSLRAYDFNYSHSTGWKIVKRTFVIFGIGLFLNYLGLVFGTMNRLAGELPLGERLWMGLTNFSNWRILGVMQRLALSYGFAAAITLLIRHKYILHTIAVLLIGYFFLLLFGHGFEASPDNIIGIIDRALFGGSHIYKEWTTEGVEFRFDPEGLLSTLPSIAHVLIGVWVGKMLTEEKDNHRRIQHLFIGGTIILFTGLLLSYACPINKKIWSPTFVLVTCGYASLLLGLLIWIIDIKGHVAWSTFFQSFGINPLFIYVMAGIVGNLFNFTFPVADGLASIHSILYNALKTIMDNKLASLIYALLFVGVNWLISYPLYKKQLYIKI